MKKISSFARLRSAAGAWVVAALLLALAAARRPGRAGEPGGIGPLDHLPPTNGEVRVYSFLRTNEIEVHFFSRANKRNDLQASRPSTNAGAPAVWTTVLTSPSLPSDNVHITYREPLTNQFRLFRQVIR